jgi:hypothetical protein
VSCLTRISRNGCRCKLHKRTTIEGASFCKKDSAMARWNCCARSGIEVHDYRTHARDLDTRRFKDLCRRQSLLSLDDWIYMPIAYLSIQDEPEFCKQLVLSFIGKFLSLNVDPDLHWLEAETVRHARRLMRPFTAMELASHLRITDRYARKVLHGMVEKQLLNVIGGNLRFRKYQLHITEAMRRI